MIATKENWSDIQKYYKDTYIKITELGDEILYVTEVSNKSILLLNKTTGKYAEIGYASPYYISYILPKKTTFQSKAGALILQRVPARMWKRGMTSENTRIARLDSDNWVNIFISISSISAFVDKATYLSMEEALYSFKHGAVSAALSNRVSCTCSGHIYIDTTLVGRFTEKVISTKMPYIKTLFPFFNNYTILSV